MTVLTLDIETTVRNADGVGSYSVGDDRASPYHAENEAVLFGIKFDRGDVSTFPPEVSHPAMGEPQWVSVMVGQNIRFDLHYLMKHYPEWEEWLFNPRNKIWDTQLAEYILTAQQHKYASLDELATKYGGTLKDDKIKAYWEAGVQTEDIPRDELEEYLKHDVENTYLVYCQQRELAEVTGMIPLIESQMRALLATWEMSRNGMCFDYWRALDNADRLAVEIEEVQRSVQPYVDQQHPDAPAGSFSITSNDVLSRLLFGGNYTYIVQEETGEVFKTGTRKGQKKTRKAEKTALTKGLFPPRKEWETKKVGTYMVGDEIVEKLLTTGDSPEAKQLLFSVVNLRALTKDRNTYFVGFSKLAWPTDGQHRIHGKLNHCSTDTGRLSSSSPNMQNLSNKSRD
jgi:DNA polymerase I-like protein with 3'-5' exonuclease and polymerase domains